MNTRCNDDALLAPGRFVVGRRRRNRQVVDAVTGEAAAQQTEFREAHPHRIFDDFQKIGLGEERKRDIAVFIKITGKWSALNTIFYSKEIDVVY